MGINTQLVHCLSFLKADPREIFSLRVEAQVCVDILGLVYCFIPVVILMVPGQGISHQVRLAFDIHDVIVEAH